MRRSVSIQHELGVVTNICVCTVLLLVGLVLWMSHPARGNPSSMQTSVIITTIAAALLILIYGVVARRNLFAMMTTDSMTGIANKRYVLETLECELARSQRQRQSLSLAMLDLDHFKRVNDMHGHLTGDAVLCAVCDRIRGTILKDEVFARFGGEEFVVVFRGPTIESANGIVERIRRLIADAPVVTGSLTVPVTVSIGIAHTNGQQRMTPEELIALADRKLYEAKAAGRNCVRS